LLISGYLKLSFGLVRSTFKVRFTITHPMGSDKAKEASYDLEIDRLVREVASRKARKVAVQLPDGLKPYGVEVARRVEEETGATVFVSAESCYGGCDLAVEEAKHLDADLLVHYGHTAYLHTLGMPVIYLEARSTQSLEELAGRAGQLLSGSGKIGVATTVQHLHELNTFRRMLEAEFGLMVVIASRKGFCRYDGQVIGCDYSGLKAIEGQVDSFLIVGSFFHGVGAALALRKPVYMADPYSNQVQGLEEHKNRILRRRYGFIVKAEKSREFGVLVGLKEGQRNLTEALRLRELLRDAGRGVTMLFAREVTAELLDNFQSIEVFVDTACPRVALDDPERFRKPILTPGEVDVALGKLSWEGLLEKGLL